MTRDRLVGQSAVAIAVACVALVVATAGALAFPAVRTSLGFASQPPASYPTGGRIDVSAAVYGGSPYTVVLFARFGCGACERAKPLLSSLAKDIAGRPGVRFVMVTGTASRTENLAYARELGLAEAAVVSITLTDLRLRQVPTLLLVDRQGVVRYAQEGALPSSAGSELIQVLTALPHAP